MYSNRVLTNCSDNIITTEELKFKAAITSYMTFIDFDHSLIQKKKKKKRKKNIRYYYRSASELYLFRQLYRVHITRH